MAGSVAEQLHGLPAWAVTLFVWTAVIVLLVPWVVRRLNRIRRSYRKVETPRCFGSDPGAQEQAENDCLRCQFRPTCIGPIF